MLLHEFINRTGFTPTEECYKELIEPEYEKSELAKDEWCKQWKSNDGIQKAYDWEHGRYQTAETMRETEHMNCQHYAKLAEERKVEIDELKETLGDVSLKASELDYLHQELLDYLINASAQYNVPELAKKAKDRMGMRRYIARKMDLGHALDDTEIDYIKQLLNNE